MGGEAKLESNSVGLRGVTSNSAFSEIVWSISRSFPKLEKDSSEAFLKGLWWRPYGPRGETGLGATKRFVLSGTGDE